VSAVPERIPLRFFLDARGTLVSQLITVESDLLRLVERALATEALAVVRVHASGRDRLVIEPIPAYLRAKEISE
jgi:hypothetical protein